MSKGCRGLEVKFVSKETDFQTQPFRLRTSFERKDFNDWNSAWLGYFQNIFYVILQKIGIIWSKITFSSIFDPENSRNLEKKFFKMVLIPFKASILPCDITYSCFVAERSPNKWPIISDSVAVFTEGAFFKLDFSL